MTGASAGIPSEPPETARRLDRRNRVREVDTGHAEVVEQPAIPATARAEPDGVDAQERAAVVAEKAGRPVELSVAALVDARHHERADRAERMWQPQDAEDRKSRRRRDPDDGAELARTQQSPEGLVGVLRRRLVHRDPPPAGLSSRVLVAEHVRGMPSPGELDREVGRQHLGPAHRRMELLDDDQDAIAGARGLAAAPQGSGADRLGLASLLEVRRRAQRVAGMRIGVGQLAAGVQDDRQVGERLGPDSRSDRSLAPHRLQAGQRSHPVPRLEASLGGPHRGAEFGLVERHTESPAPTSITR